MKKFILAAALAATAVVGIVGCSTVDQGRISADIVYKVYEKIAEKEGSEIAARIQAFWIRIDAVQSFEELPAVYKESVADLDALIEQTKNPLVKYVLKHVKKTVDDYVTKAISKEVSKKEAQEYLIAFRNELRKKFEACVNCTDISQCGF